MVREDEPGAKRLVAYVVPRSRGATAARDHAGRQVARWREIFDEQIYRRVEAAPADPLFDTTGWMSSYDGRPLPQTEMRAWADDGPRTTTLPCDVS